MTIQTLSLTAMAAKMANALATSTAINAFCASYFATTPNIYVGYNGKKPPSEKNCPYIVIVPDQKNEGLQVDEQTYMFSVGFAVLSDAVTTSGKITTQTGMSLCEQFGQLIYSALATAGNYPVYQAGYVFELQAYWPQAIGQMDIEIRAAIAMGGDLSY
jgi:hypothetical protein